MLGIGDIGCGGTPPAAEGSGSLGLAALGAAARCRRHAAYIEHYAHSNRVCRLISPKVSIDSGPPLLYSATIL